MKEISAKYAALMNISKVFLNANKIIAEIERSLKNAEANLDWEVPSKQDIAGKLSRITKMLQEFNQLTQDMSSYTKSTVELFKSTDARMSSRIDEAYAMAGIILGGGTAIGATFGFNGMPYNPKNYTSNDAWYKTMRISAGASDIYSGKTSACGDPVNIASGNFITRKIDLHIGGFNPIEFARFYNTLDSFKGDIGYSWHHSYEARLEKSVDKVTVIYEDGRIEEYVDKNGRYKGLAGNKNRLVREPSKPFEVRFPEGNKLFFDVETGRLEVQVDANGNRTELEYDESQKLRCIKNVCGILELQFNKAGLLEKVSDHTGRTVQYGYEAERLVSITDVEGNESKYEYDSDGRIFRIMGLDGTVKVENQYDRYGRTIEQTTSDGIKTFFTYDDETLKNTFTDKNGNAITYIRDDENRIKETVYSDGTEKIIFDSVGQITEFTDKEGNQYTYTYDAKGNIETERDSRGFKTCYTYNSNNKVTSIIKPDGSRYLYEYDIQGNVTCAKDPLDRVIKVEYNEKGQVSTVHQPDDSVIQVQYDDKGNVVASIDPMGYTTCFEYDDLNRLVLVKKPEGNTMKYEYTPKGKVTMMTAPEGSQKSVKYNLQGQVVEKIEVDGSKVTYIYDAMENVTQITNEIGDITQFEYDTMGNVTKVIHPNNGVICYEYDLTGNMIKMTDPEGNAAKYEYTPNGNVKKSIDPRGAEASFVYDALNQVIEAVSPSGAVSKFDYDFDGQLLSSINALNERIEYKYNRARQLVEVSNHEGHGVKYDYDSMGRIKRVTDPKGAATSYEYNQNGNVIRAIYPDGSSEQYEYNKNGKVVRSINALGAATLYSYDDMERVVAVTDAQGHQKNFHYTAKGQIESVTDENGYNTGYTYDLVGRLVGVTDANGHVTKYVYDSVGNLVEVHRSGTLTKDTVERMYEGVKVVPFENKYITRYQYDLRGLVSKEINPTGKVTEYVYDQNGNMLSKTDRDSFTTTFEYDMVNNLTKVCYADQKEINYEYDKVGRIIGMKDWLGDNSFELDSLGRIKKLKDFAGRVVEYAWNPKNERESVTYPDGSKVNYEYDMMGRLSKVRDMNNGETSYTYDRAGRMSKQTLPNNVVTEYSYNQLSRLTELKSVKDGNVLESHEFSYDAAGNKVAINRNGETVNYAYDRLNQLIEEQKPGNRVSKYFYDTLGNRAGIEDWDGETKPRITQYGYDGDERLVSIQGARCNILGNKNPLPEGIKMEYDARGNLVKAVSGSRLLGQFVFDATNMLTAATNKDGMTTKFAYDGMSRRVKAGEIDYLCDITRQYNSVLTAGDKKYVYGAGVSPLQAFTGDSCQYYVSDELGSPIRIIAESGLSEGQKYDVFGMTQGQDLFSYTGYQNDDATGLMYAQARYYIPEAGRFISEDLYKGEVVSPISLNRDVYCTNNPLKFIDPSGHISKCSEFEKSNNSILDEISAIAGGIRTVANSAQKGIGIYINNKVESLPTYKKIIEAIKPGKGTTTIVDDILSKGDDLKYFISSSYSKFGVELGGISKAKTAANLSKFSSGFRIAGKVAKFLTPIIEFGTSKDAYFKYISDDASILEKTIGYIGAGSDACSFGFGRSIVKTVTLAKYVPYVPDKWADELEDWTNENVNAMNVVEKVAGLFNMIKDYMVTYV